MKVVAIIQARMNSSRLPGKVLMKINGMSVIEIILKRLSKAKNLDAIAVATSTNHENDILAKHIKKLGFMCIRGSEEDVLSRYLKAANSLNGNTLVRITGDCPLIDPCLVDKMIKLYEEKKVDYLSNVEPPTFPDGLDIEIFTKRALEISTIQSKDPNDREHVTSYIRNSKLFTKYNIANPTDLSRVRWTLDEFEDYQVISKIFSEFYPNIFFTWEDILKIPPDKLINSLNNLDTKRNEGSKMGKGQKLWSRAKRVIPGGNMLLSKRVEMFHPTKWPAYFKKAKGCHVWDLDNQKFTDMCLMGVGTNTLGYGHPEVDKAVITTVKNGNMSTLNCPEEVMLAEKLIDMHPWSEMVRFARSGGEANSIAVRIARAASGKDGVAICGYHGWHDWYIAANLNNTENLSSHLLPGLNPAGVPKVLKDTVFPFEYNDLNALKKIISTNAIGVIKMEVVRNIAPIEKFLEQVREIATKNKIVLVFDECTSGFRENFGGLHLKYKVDPDIAILGKTLGNGYAISSVIGTRSVMDVAQSTFISSTFWTERIGPTAALKTLEIMEREKSWNEISRLGKIIKKGWLEMAKSHKLKITTWGLPALAGFNFISKNSLQYKTLITQEMLKKKFLASNSIYTSTSHTEKHLNTYFRHLDKIFTTIKDCEDEREDVSKLLGGITCHDGFKRLN